MSRLTLLILLLACLACTSYARNKVVSVIPTMQEIVDKINEVRQDPPSFAAVLQKNYTNFYRWRWTVGNDTFITQEGILAVWEAMAALTAASAVPNVSLARGLDASAQMYTNSMKNISFISEPYNVCSRTLSERVSEVGNFTSIGESIVGNVYLAENIVAALLIGDGDFYRRARSDILDAKYTHVGIGRSNTTVYNFTTRILWAEGFNCDTSCPRVPTETAYYDCQQPTPYTFGSAGMLDTCMGLLFATIVILLIKFE